jgi:hypothetical protein
MARRIALCLLAFCGAPAAAYGAVPMPIISFSASTNGIGWDVGLHDPGWLFGFRAGAHFARLDFHEHYLSSADNDVASYQNADFLVDYYPERGRFFLATGFILNINRLYIHSVPTSFHGSTGGFTGTVRFNAIAPYIGLGYTLPLGGPWSLTADLGTMFQNTGRETVHENGSISLSSRAAADTLDATRHDLRTFRNLAFYPILGFELSYRF